MTLTYRGIQYNENNSHKTTSVLLIKDNDIVYRGNSPQARITPKFPWWRYLKQLFKNSESQPIVDPITFWYNHKREFLNDLWRSEDFKKLDRCWDLTLQIEQTKAVQSKHKIKLKYRGVTYYR